MLQIFHIKVVNEWIKGKNPRRVKDAKGENEAKGLRIYSALVIAISHEKYIQIVSTVPSIISDCWTLLSEFKSIC